MMLSIGGFAQAVRLTGMHADPVQELFGDPAGAVTVVDRRDRGGALRDGPVEQSRRGGTGHQRGEDAGAGGFTEQRDIVGVTTECRDIALHPVQGRKHVAHTDIGLESGPERRQIQEPQRTQPIVHRHHHDVTAGSQLATAVQRLRRRASA